MKAARAVPRPFTMHWGGGQIVEEASCLGPYNEPTIQLLEYSDGEAAGQWSVRFCYYDHQGRFQRNPMMINEETLEGLRAALARTPRLRALLRRLVE